MIPARKSKWFSAWFARHLEGRFRRTFSRIHVDGLDRLRAAGAGGPVILVSNHTSWWDAILAVYLITRVCRLDGYAMMDADNLRRMPFFGRVGAFGVERRGAGGDRDAIEYGKTLLSGPGKLVWVFPQGDERPVTLRPLGFRRGAAVVACGTGVPVIPLGIRYVFGAREKPELYLALGELSPPLADIEGERARQEAAVEARLAHIEATLCSDARFDLLWKSEPGLLARLAERSLSWFTRRAVRPGPALDPPDPGAGDDPAK